MVQYPWYEKLEKCDILEQGDIIYDCPVIKPPSDLKIGSDIYSLEAELYDVIVLSQSCDLLQSKIDLVLVCEISSFKDYFTKLKEHDNSYKEKNFFETLRKGLYPNLHLLNKIETEDLNLDFHVVDFHTVFSLHFEYLKKLAKNKDIRLRLLPPYREHLSQAFARYIMRVGLPIDIHLS